MKRNDSSSNSGTHPKLLLLAQWSDDYTLFKFISVTGAILFAMSEKINKDKKNNERYKIIKLGYNVIFEISMEYFKTRAYQSSLKHYK